MEAAALALDFEQAKQLRDRINPIRGGATADAAEEADVSGLARQMPGSMGLGTIQSRPVTPAGLALVSNLMNNLPAGLIASTAPRRRNRHALSPMHCLSGSIPDRTCR